MSEQTDVPVEPVRIERTFDAPIEVVWRMWTVGEHFARWYGPSGASVPVAELEARVGGARRVCLEMATPDGPMTMWFVGEFTEVEAPTRLVYTEAMAEPDGTPKPPPPGPTTVEVELRERDGRTELVLTHHGVPADSPGAMGWTMALDDLAAELATEAG